MLLPAGLDRDRHLDLVEVERCSFSVVVDCQNVQFELRKIRSKQREGSGAIGHVDAQAQISPRHGQPVFDEAG